MRLRIEAYSASKRKYLKNSLVTFSKVLLVQAGHNSGILGCKMLLGTTCSILVFTLQSQTMLPLLEKCDDSKQHSAWQMRSTCHARH